MTLIAQENMPRERMKKLGLDAEVLALIVQKGTRKDNVVILANLIQNIYKLNFIKIY